MKKASRLVSALCTGILAASVAAVPTFAASSISVIPTRALDNAGNMYVTVVQDGQNYAGQVVDGVLTYTNNAGQKVQQKLTSGTIQDLTDTLNENTNAVARNVDQFNATNHDAVADSASKTQGILQDAGDSVAKGSQTAINDMSAGVSGVLGNAASSANEVMNNTQERTVNTINALGDVASDRVKQVGQNVNDVVDYAGKSVNDVVQNSVSNGVGIVKNGVDNANTIARAAAKTGLDTLIKTGQSALEGAAQGTMQAVSNAALDLPRSIAQGFFGSL